MSRVPDEADDGVGGEDCGGDCEPGTCCDCDDDRLDCVVVEPDDDPYDYCDDERVVGRTGTRDEA